MRLAALLRKLGLVARESILEARLTGPTLAVTRIKNYSDYLEYIHDQNSVYAKRIATEAQCIGKGNQFYTKAYCYTCGMRRALVSNYTYSFMAENGNQIPNWREHLLCENCMLNNRMRAAIQLFEQECGSDKRLAIYLTECKTPLYRWLKNQYPNTEGSEYLGDMIPYGTEDKDGVRNETLTKLTWDSQKFDVILSFDVFEHIPNYIKAFRECARVLKPNGKILFTVPFELNNKHNLIRAQVGNNGAIKHLLPPEYHGDPLNQEGCLAFYHFGWEMLDEVRSCGFSEVTALFYWSRKLGYLGIDQLAFIAQAVGG
jgi:SAM-dependent methyltransferase